MQEKKKIHVLLIESDFSVSSCYREALTQSGFVVTVTDNGIDGEKQIKKKKPDVIVLDILLQKKDGFSILHDIRRDARTAHIPVIILTHLGHKADMAKGMSLGANAYFIKVHSKPCDIIKIIEGLKEYGGKACQKN